MKMDIRSILILGLAVVWLCVFGLGCGTSDDDDDDDTGAQNDPPVQDVTPVNEPPVQDVAPVVKALSIGVPDLEAATAFYRDAIGMEVLAPGDYPDYLDQDGMDVVVLASYQEGRRGAILVLMNDPNVTDPNYYADNPDKLVFLVPDAQSFYDGIMAAGGSEVGAGGTPPAYLDYLPPGGLVGLAYDPNGYLIEMLYIPSEILLDVYNLEVTDPYITGLGIGVSDLDESEEFYTRVLGFLFETDIPVEGFMNEKQLGVPSGAKLNVVLMNYFNTSIDYTDNPVKLVLEVEDAEGFFGIVEEEDPDLIVSPLTTLPSGAVTGYAVDLDGTTIQVVQPAP